MAEVSNRRTSIPTMSTMSPEQIQPYRSLRGEKRTKIKKIPEIAIIPEVDVEVVEERKLKSKISSRPSSTGSLKLEKIDVYERVIQSSTNKKEAHLQPNTNLGFSGSNFQIHSSTSSLQSSPIVREQYCSCCRRWTKREKILLVVVAFLVLVIFALFIALGILIARVNNSTEKTWFSLKL